jgi:RND family efflux transporter MFP subunit
MIKTVALLLFIAANTATAAEFIVRPAQLSDEKAVFATIESRNVVPARARIGGTVTALAVRQGDAVKQGQIIATVSDPKLPLQIQALDAQIEGAQSRLAQARLDLNRAQQLARTGAGSQAALDAAATAERVALSSLASLQSQRDVAREQLAEAAVLAPADGRVLEIPVINGSVLLPGDAVATVAERDYQLRLSVPERHAQLLHPGDSVRIDGEEFGQTAPSFGKITLIYPQIQDGRVRVDASAEGVGDYFVGERIRVWISAGSRPGFVIPQSFVATRFGVDYVRLRQGADKAIDIPIQRGRPAPSPAMTDGLEVLSGLSDGQILVTP